MTCPRRSLRTLAHTTCIPPDKVWSPSSPNKAIEFKLISYVHGFIGGGVIESTAYFELLRSFAAFGYVIVAPRACDVGCADRPKR